MSVGLARGSARKCRRSSSFFMSNAPTDELTDTTLPTAATWKASMHAWHVQIGPHSEMKSLLTVAVFWRFGTSTHRRCRPCTRQGQRIWRPRSSIEQDREPSGRPRCRTGLCQGPPESTHAQRTRCRWSNTVARDKGLRTRSFLLEYFQPHSENHQRLQPTCWVHQVSYKWAHT